MRSSRPRRLAVRTRRPVREEHDRPVEIDGAQQSWSLDGMMLRSDLAANCQVFGSVAPPTMRNLVLAVPSDSPSAATESCSSSDRPTDRRPCRRQSLSAQRAKISTAMSDDPDRVASGCSVVDR